MTREEKIHHRAHRGHREKGFCLRGQGITALCLLTRSFISVFSP